MAMSPKRQRALEGWREVLQCLADRLPDHPLDPPDDDDDDDDPEDSRGSEIPSLTSEPIPE